MVKERTCQTDFDEQQVAWVQFPVEGRQLAKDDIVIAVSPVRTLSDEFVEVSERTEVVQRGSVERHVTTEQMTVSFADKAFAPMFRVEIRNNTDHVVSLDGLVVAYVPPTGNPVSALAQGSHADSLTGGERSANREARDALKGGQTSAAVESAARALDLPFLKESLKVLPGYSYTALVAFDLDLRRAGDSGKLVFFELVTQVDSAGNPTKRANFEFPLSVRHSKAEGAEVLGKEAQAFFARCERYRREREREAAVSAGPRSDVRPKARKRALKPGESCADGSDNDGDGWIDVADPDCARSFEESGTIKAGECNDGVDNDSDSKVDADDPECQRATDSTEAG